MSRLSKSLYALKELVIHLLDLHDPATKPDYGFSSAPGIHSQSKCLFGVSILAENWQWSKAQELCLIMLKGKHIKEDEKMFTSWI